MSIKWFTVLGLLFFGGLSCGSSSSSNSSSNNIPRADACAQASQAACAKVFACSATTDPVIAGIRFSLGGTEDSCKATIGAMYCKVLECATPADYHGDKAAQCKQQFTDITCSGLSAAGVAAISGGVPAFLAAFPQCGQICTGPDAG